MKKISLKALITNSTGKVLAALLLFNVLYLIAGLFRIGSLEVFKITFRHGYFILNGEQVGINLFANISVFVLAVTLLMIYQIYLYKPKNEA